MELFDSAGQRIAIEKEMFRGGEGTIHPVIGNSALFAKLYHQQIDALKQAKLAAMTATASDALLRVAAWPSATLHAGRGGSMVGFVMPRFDGQRSELHDLYRPGSRKQKFGKADWSFLVQAARNVAASVATVHAAGHVVGDVNQRNFIVGGDATVKVLDCDSFQIRGPGGMLRCVVGVPEFTPPELQGRPLDSVDRTPDHDAFGLAVLVFQLLFMGRHPFALAAGDVPIERAIAEGRFAFGRAARTRVLKLPPDVLRFEALPPRLAALFEGSFGGGGARPTAKNWSDALDVTQTELRACTAEPMHKYYKALPECAWCALERVAGVYFFISGGPAKVTTFDLARLWAEITVATGLPYEAPLRPTIHVEGESAPGILTIRRRMGLGAKVLAAIVLCVLAITTPEWLVMAGIATFLIFLLPLPGAEERRRRLARFHAAERAWMEAYKSAEGALSVEPLQRKRLELQRLKATYETLDGERQKELSKLVANAREIQLHHYLEQHLIRVHTIPDIGPRRKATLAAWGIDTADDVTWQKLAAVQGFGPTLQARLIGWRQHIESQFVFDAKRTIPQSELDAVEYRWRRRKTDLEGQLRIGAEEARRANQAIRQRRQTTARDLEQPAREWAQSRADLEVINKVLSFRGGATP
jgi:DNA-binding helix-hairpin-helix protein with protein kinase domain